MDAEFLRELFAEFGPITVRRMFSGAGVYADGVIIALVIRDVLYLKADAATSARFAAEGCGAFEYQRKVTCHGTFIQRRLEPRPMLRLSAR